MKNKSSIEEEIINKLDFEVMKKEHANNTPLDEKFDSGENTADIDLISINAVGKLIEDISDDTTELSVDDSAPKDYEDEPIPTNTNEELDSGLFYSKGLAKLEETEEQEIDNMAKKQLLEKDVTTYKKTKDSNLTLKKAYNIATASIILLLLVVTFLLVLYINVIKSSKENIVASDGNNSTVNGNPAKEQAYIESIEKQNNELIKETQSLRNELATLTASSNARSAEVGITSKTVQAQANQNDSQTQKVAGNQAVLNVQNTPTATPKLNTPAPTNSIPKKQVDNTATTDANPASKASTPAKESVEKKTDKPRTYIVKEGDSLQGIAISIYGNKNQYKKIVEANNIKNDIIKIGQKLNIP